MPIISLDTISSSLYPNDSLAAAFIALLTPSSVTVSVESFNTAVRIVVDPVGTGTLCADPFSLPSSSGMTRPIALAAPVEFGTMLIAPALALLKLFFLCGPSRII